MTRANKAAFKNNDQLKTNTTLQTCCDGRWHGGRALARRVESAKIEFKVI